ncbi:hypothetical protein SAMN02983003_0440 [Devosia enhydra]|uniref:Uncharacterized protein n=1 Tax=Devosia enhydra TaxID=665118 RepID=A0A1K2HTA1_9HYPH|nr:hypothetical protein [Devosia enhydra]SFZ81330.1 hypothetical protein SAMN02983003_0440 [Devosia enhydra]
MADRRKTLFQRISDWYEGKMIPHDNLPASEVFFFGWYYERHWTANVARVLFTFYLAHWQWLIGTIIGVAGLWVAILALR